MWETQLKNQTRRSLASICYSKPVLIAGGKKIQILILFRSPLSFVWIRPDAEMQTFLFRLLQEKRRPCSWARTYCAKGCFVSRRCHTNTKSVSMAMTKIVSLTTVNVAIKRRTNTDYTERHWWLWRCRGCSYSPRSGPADSYLTKSSMSPFARSEQIKTHVK